MEILVFGGICNVYDIFKVFCFGVKVVGILGIVLIYLMNYGVEEIIMLMK